jgi:hydroxylamine reductase (hybrid-cluster protein)
MNQREAKIQAMIEEAKKLGLDLSDELIEKVVVGLGPSVYKKASELVSCSQPKELETIRENFLKKKLGLTLSDEVLDAAIKEVCEILGSSNRAKKRVHFYALLVKKFNKEDIYDK